MNTQLVSTTIKITKIEALLNGLGSKRQRCIWAGFYMGNAPSEEIEKMCNFYNIAYVDFPTTWACMDVIKYEYGKRVNNLKFSFIQKLMEDMFQQQENVDSNTIDEIQEEIEKFMCN